MSTRASILALVTLAGALTLARPGVAADGKIAITTSSPEARDAYLQGRDLAERLKAHSSLEHFQKAVRLDPAFALAEMGLATSAPTAREGFEHMKRAAGLADRASDGERLLILATEAGFNGDVARQRQHLVELIEVAPKDERAHLGLGVYHYGQQDYEAALEHLRKAAELAPGYSPVHNILGYTYRDMGRLDEAEQAFRRYVEMIPDDPNPYDSHAELLLKMGRYDEAIAAYRKALALDPRFPSAHAGVAIAQVYQGRSQAARQELAKMYGTARNDGERRGALFAMAVLEADAGRLPEALGQIRKEYAIAERTGDVASMAADLRTEGLILVEMGRPDEARAAFDRALDLVSRSDLEANVKRNAGILHHYDAMTVALADRKLDEAKAEAAKFREAVAPLENRGFTRLAHQAAGMVALAAKDWSTAVSELEQADHQNAYNLYRLGLAYQGRGAAAQAREHFARAARFNSIPALNTAFVRTKAEKMMRVAKL